MAGVPCALTSCNDFRYTVGYSPSSYLKVILVSPPPTVVSGLVKRVALRRECSLCRRHYTTCLVPNTPWNSERGRAGGRARHVAKVGVFRPSIGRLYALTAWTRGMDWKPQSTRRGAVHSSIRRCVYPSVNTSLRLPVRQSVNPSIRQSTEPSIDQSVNPPSHRSTNPSICPCIRQSISVNPSIHPPVRPSTRIPIRPQTHPFAHPQIHPFTHQSVHPSVRQSVNWPTHKSVNRCMRASIHQSINPPTRRPVGPPTPIFPRFNVANQPPTIADTIPSPTITRRDGMFADGW